MAHQTIAHLKLDPLEDLFTRPDEPATAEMPPRTDVHDYEALSADGTPVAYASINGGAAIRFTGEIVERAPLVSKGERLGLEELRKATKDLPYPEAYRPKWLAATYAPRLLQRVRVGFGGIVLRYFESPGTEWPWCTIGRLFLTQPGQPSYGVGTGTLVGPRLLLTASHVVPWGSASFGLRFAPNYRDGNDPRFGHAYVDEWRGVPASSSPNGLDYVICRLSWRIGDRTGWMGSWWSSDEDFYYNGTWLSVGYPGTGRPQVEVPIRVQDIDNEADGLEIETHPFVDPGWSGGPLWAQVEGQQRVVGVTSGWEYDGYDPRRAVFAGGEHMVNLVRYGWANWG